MGAALVIGASGGIGRALTDHWLAQGRNVLAVSRTALAIDHPQLSQLRGAQNEAGIERVVAELQDWQGRIERVVVCSGLLHGEVAQADGTTLTLAPEKRLQDLTANQLLASLQINTVLPALWLARLLPVLRGGDTCVYATLSARVGSIGDNRLGGWYSYRSSKAALNMLLKTAAVEYARRAGNVKLLAFHPGTTDTPLSKPFQANVPAGRLFTPGFVAAQLDSIMDRLQPDGQLDYLDWQGQPIEW